MVSSQHNKVVDHMTITIREFTRGISVNVVANIKHTESSRRKTIGKR
jgi:hypothetical protein